MAFEHGTIPNSLRPEAERDPRPVIYICYRAWEPTLKWAARADGAASFVFGEKRSEALFAAAIKAAGLDPNDQETAMEIIRGSRIKTFEVRPPKAKE